MAVVSGKHGSAQKRLKRDKGLQFLYVCKSRGSDWIGVRNRHFKRELSPPSIGGPCPGKEWSLGKWIPFGKPPTLT